eukprot:COSAG01_NODE_2966_length_6790_cov_15.092662_10_plen_137_part_00
MLMSDAPEPETTDHESAEELSQVITDPNDLDDLRADITALTEMVRELAVSRTSLTAEALARRAALARVTPGAGAVFTRPPLSPGDMARISTNSRSPRKGEVVRITSVKDGAAKWAAGDGKYGGPMKFNLLEGGRMK